MMHRRNAGERNIKFVVVLMLKPNHIDDARTEERISFIRKQCGLDAKGSLFVLPSGQKDGSPVDLGEFVSGLQKLLYETSLNFYREHSKRIKKKKSRLPDLSRRASPTSAAFQPNLSSLVVTTPGGTSAKPLAPLGWSIRYEYKMGVFAEFRQDVDNAVSHYETAYQQLIDLITGGLGTGAVSGGTTGEPYLQPFTHRWHEARVLADCINLKICKLYLYSDIPVPALKQLHKHLGNVRSLPEFAGPTNSSANVTAGLSHLAKVPGGGSFEYWSWVSKQYRVFGELIEIATGKIGVKVPFPPPGSLPSNNSATSQAQSLLNTLSNTAGSVIAGGELPITVFGPFSASNPVQTVQHAGYYYYMASKCAEERWKRFKEAEANIPPLPPSAAMLTRSPSRTTFEGLTAFPSSLLTQPHAGQALAAERTIDHGTITIELLTKSYEQFKKHKSGRMTLYLASEIARVYEESGKYEMALKFFERIGKTYRKENWPAVLRSILTWSVRCARMLGLWQTVVESYVELLSERMTMDEKDREEVLQALLMVLSGEDPGILGADVGEAIVPVDAKPVAVKTSVDMDQINKFINCGVQLKKGTTYAGTPARFQIVLSGNGAASPPVPVKVSKVVVRFSDSQYDYAFVDGGDRSEAHLSTQFLDCTGCEKRRMSLFGADGDREVWTKEVDLEFRPGMRKVLEGEIVPFESQDLKITEVSLLMEPGTAEGGVLSLDFKISERPEDTTTRRRWFVPVAPDAPAKITSLDGYGELTSLRVIRRQPNISIEIKHTPPGYLDEVYPIEVVVTNNETDTVQGLLDVEFRSAGTDGADATSSLSLEPPPDNEKSSPFGGVGTPQSNTTNDVDLGIIAPGSSVSKSFYLRANRNVAERVLYTTIIYRSVTDAGAASITPIDRASHEGVFRKGETARISFGKAFDATFEVCQQSAPAFGEGDEAGLLAGGEDGEFVKLEKYLLLGSVKCLGPWDVEVANDWLVEEREQDYEGSAGPRIKVVPVKPPDAVQQSIAWKSGHIYNFAYNVEVTVDALAQGLHAQVGSLGVRWRRVSQSDAPSQATWSHSIISIPKITLNSEDIRVHFDIPATAQLGTPFTLTFSFQNTSLQLAELTVQVESSEQFVFAGYKNVHLRVVPSGSLKMRWNVLPVVGGWGVLPRVRVFRKGAGGGEGREVQVGRGGDVGIFVLPKVGW